MIIIFKPYARTSPRHKRTDSGDCFQAVINTHSYEINNRTDNGWYRGPNHLFYFCRSHCDRIQIMLQLRFPAASKYFFESTLAIILDYSRMQ